MRQLVLALSVGSVVALIAASCGSDVDTNPGTGGTGGAGSGGDGGAATTTTTSTGMGGTTNPCDTTFPTTCEEACCKVEVTCGLSGACATAFGLLGIQCGDPEAECVGAALLDPDVSCADIPGLANGTAPQELQNALFACLEDDPCLQCGVGSCQNEAFACQAVTECAAFIECVSTAACNDQACITQCATDNPSAETSALVGCLETNCADDCLGGGTGGAGGAGGGGGAGGAGGAGGN